MKKMYLLEYWDYYLHRYTHNILTDIFFGLLQVFPELGSLYRAFNWTLYLLRRGRLFQFCELWPSRSVKKCKYSLLLTCRWKWTCNVKRISCGSHFQPNPFTHCTICPTKTFGSDWYLSYKNMWQSSLYFIIDACLAFIFMPNGETICW